jgi:hypothetical protein
MSSRSAGVWIAVAVVAGGCSQQVPAPTAYTAFEVKDGAFSCEYPQGWKAESGARSDNMYSWARFSQGPARIKITADTAGSLKGDIAGAGMGGLGGLGGEPDPEAAPVAIVHEDNKRRMDDDFSNYTEGPPDVIRPGAGEGRVSIFEANGKKVVGYRATFLLKNRCLTVVCSCPRNQWGRLKPAFQEVVRKVSR